MKIFPMGAELYAERRTDRYDEANSRSSQILRKRLKFITLSAALYECTGWSLMEGRKF
jgi:hypothetical protein